MSTDSADTAHGNSPAAWVAVVTMLIGFAIGTVAFFFSVVWLVWASVGLVVLGLAAGFVLAKAGYGVNGAKYSPKAHN